MGGGLIGLAVIVIVHNLLVHAKQTRFFLLVKVVVVLIDCFFFGLAFAVDETVGLVRVLVPDDVVLTQLHLTGILIYGE